MSTAHLVSVREQRQLRPGHHYAFLKRSTVSVCDRKTWLCCLPNAAPAPFFGGLLDPPACMLGPAAMSLPITADGAGP